MSTLPPSGGPRDGGTPARTALLLAFVALAVVAGTVALVLRGSRASEPDLRTVSVTFAVPGGDSSIFREERVALIDAAGALAQRLGRALEADGGLVWLPDVNEIAAADVRVTGLVDWANPPSDDSVGVVVEVSNAGRLDTIRSSVRFDWTNGGELAERVLAVLDRRRPSRSRVDARPTATAPLLTHLPSLVLRQRHGKPWRAEITSDLVAGMDALPIVERDLLRAALIDDLPTRLDSLEAVASRFHAYWPARWMHADALAHYGALAGRSPDEVRRALREAAGAVPRPGPRRLDAHLRALETAGRPPLDRAEAWAARGAWDSAYPRSAAGPEAAPSRALEAYRLAVIGHWLGGIDAGAVDERRRTLSPGVLDAPQRAELAWLDGLAAAVARDGPAIDRARLRLRESAAPGARDLERSLRAFQLATAEDEEMRAARLLRSLEEERASRLRLAATENDAHPYLTGVNRLAAAHWFIRHGRSSYALPLLGWWERVPVGAPATSVADAVLAPIDDLERARAYRELGRFPDAARHFRRFLGAYDRPVEAHRAWVRDARQALAALGESGEVR
jgi:tetratricopeptide (TPR) repeat protein